MVAVSIIVPCFNAADFIAEGLASVQRQSFSDWECLVVDDCSTDKSVAVLHDLARADPRIVPIVHERNGGAAAARNTAIEAASGTWLTLLDADDVYAPDRLARLVTLAQTNDADMVFDNQAVSDFPSTQQVDTAFHWLTGEAVPFTREEFFARSADFGRSINPGYMKPLFRDSFIDAHHLRYDPEFRSGQDFLFYANAFAHDPKCFATAYCGYIYRRRPGSLSRSGGQHLRNHARLSDEIMARHSARLAPASKRALARRKTYFTRAAALHETRLALAERGPLAALKSVFANPGALLAALTALRRRLLFKV
jgi:glycosyltransferase involved in cell wall biosynthesis